MGSVTQDKHSLYERMQEFGVTLQAVADETRRSKSGVHAQLTGICGVQSDVAEAVKTLIAHKQFEADEGEIEVNAQNYLVAFEMKYGDSDKSCTACCVARGVSREIIKRLVPNKLRERIQWAFPAAEISGILGITVLNSAPAIDHDHTAEPFGIIDLTDVPLTEENAREIAEELFLIQDFPRRVIEHDDWETTSGSDGIDFQKNVYLERKNGPSQLVIFRVQVDYASGQVSKETCSG